MSLFIPGCILILMSSAILAEYTFDCSDYEKPVILETHFCTIKTSYDADNEETLLAVLPYTIESQDTNSAEIVTITPPSNRFKYYVRNTVEVLYLFPAVRYLSLSGFSNVFFGVSKDEREETLKQLFDLPALDGFTFTDSHLNSETHNWTLPEKLRYLNFSKNEYTDYDIRNLKYVEVIDFSKNNLTKIPNLAYPLRTLRELNLSENPLNNVTTEDIAKLCTLEKLILKSTGLTESEEEERFCECKKLKKWIAKLRVWLKKEHFKPFEVIMEPCNELKDNVLCTQVLGDKYSLNEAFLLRENCLTGKNSTIGDVNLKLDDNDDYDDIEKKSDHKSDKTKKMLPSGRNNTR